MNILDKLAAHARERVAIAQQKLSFEKCQSLAKECSLALEPFALECSLKRRNELGQIAIIGECKKASPSKGIIAQDFPYLAIAKEYESAGADGISVLTEPKWFLGSDSYLEQIAKEVKVPVLRKDFTVSDYQIYEAKLLGASAVLLICSLLSKDELLHMINLCDQLELSALVEAHDAQEIEMALSVGARLIGVNNRNLKDFTVDTQNSTRLRQLVPQDVLFVAESGVSCASDVQALKKAGVNAILVGESLMRADNKTAHLNMLRNA